MLPWCSAGKESACKAGDPSLIPGLRRPPWRTDRLPTPVSLVAQLVKSMPAVWETLVPSLGLESILKSRDIALPTKVRLVKVMVFQVVLYACQSLIIKKAECRRTDTFELWCWRRPLRDPWTARRSNQPILKEISPVFIGRTDVKAETPILWPPDAKS